MSILIARDIELAFGNRRILRGCDLNVQMGAKVGLVGANGSGKSTLLRVLAGQFRPDHGSVQLSGRLGFLDQNPELDGTTVGDCAREAVAWHGALLAEYGRALDAQDMTRSAALQDRIDAVGWEVDHRVDAMLDRLGAPPREAAVQQLSGGERRRLALALALLGQPELLMLDEPTNHLDADAVEWLQAWLQGYRGALLLVTHDRYLLEAVADTIVEIEAGATVSYPGSYADYLVARAERQVALHKAETRRLSMIAREAVWASRSPAARSTKQKARLQRLDALREQEGLALDRGFELDLRTGVRQGSVLVELTGVRKAYGGRELLGGLDLSLAPGERLGVLGPNGAGKSTLLRILAGTLDPDAGQVSRASRVKVAVLNQERTGLEAPDGSDWTVFEAAGGGNDYVFVAGRQGATWQRGAGGREEGAVHVASFLGRFMFPREALEQRVSALSGGERARLLLARLLLEGASVLLLDEPTNDLDLLTLRVLEEALLAYDGSAIIVTHDRAFLDRVCTGVIAFEPDQDPPVVRYGSRLQHVRAIDERRKLSREQERQGERQRPTRQSPPSPRRKKLSYREKQEFEGLPARIEAAEAEQEALAERLAAPETYRSGQDVAALQARTAALPGEIEALYERWAELEERAG